MNRRELLTGCAAAAVSAALPAPALGLVPPYDNTVLPDLPLDYFLVDIKTGFERRVSWSQVMQEYHSSGTVAWRLANL